MSRERFDLHTHSTASDGSMPPREVVALAAGRGLAGIALTDHDTVAGLAEAIGMAAALGLRCIPGIELSCTLDGHGDVHLLGYFIDPGNEQLLQLLEERELERIDRAERTVDRLGALGVDITMDDIMSETDGHAPGRPHIARALVRRGIVRDVAGAFTAEWLGSGGRAHVPWNATALADGIDVVHDAGGVAVFAHPGARASDGYPEDAVRHAAALGLDGIEVDHPAHDGEDVERSARIATELKLVQTAGSDDHGHGVDGSRLGCRTVTSRIVDALEARARASHARQHQGS